MLKLMVNALKQHAITLTNQRKKILELFETTFQGEHLSAEEIYQQLSRKGEKISPSTIYRTLHVMVELGILREVELAEGKSFMNSALLL